MNLKIELTGFIERIQDVQTFKNNFKKRDLILDLDKGGKWENQIAITFINEKCELLDSFNRGERVTIGVYPQGRSWLKPGKPEGERRWFNEFRGMDIRSDEQQRMEVYDAFKDSEHEPIVGDDEENLPF